MIQFAIYACAAVAFLSAAAIGQKLALWWVTR